MIIILKISFLILNTITIDKKFCWFFNIKWEKFYFFFRSILLTPSVLRNRLIKPLRLSMHFRSVLINNVRTVAWKCICYNSTTSCMHITLKNYNDIVWFKLKNSFKISDIYNIIHSNNFYWRTNRAPLNIINCVSIHKLF